MDDDSHAQATLRRLRLAQSAGSPLRRAAMTAVLIVLAIPLLALVLLGLAAVLAIAVVAAIIALLRGLVRGRPAAEPGGADAPGRVNVRVIPPQ